MGHWLEAWLEYLQRLWAAGFLLAIMLVGAIIPCIPFAVAPAFVLAWLFGLGEAGLYNLLLAFGLIAYPATVGALLRQFKRFPFLERPSAWRERKRSS